LSSRVDGRGGPIARVAASDRAFAVDAVAVGVVSAGICLASQRPALMSALVAVVLALRFAAWARLPAGERWGSLASELAFFALCAAVGAFNDWNSVVRQRIYDYAVPAFFPSISTVPLWMLIYWGMILRFLATLCRWQRLAPPTRLRDEIHLPGRIVGSPWLKVGVELLLVVLTRWLVYRHCGDPLLSWLPFAAALVLYAVLFRPERHGRRLAGIALLGGPAVEIAYIQLGQLHRYQLGWLGGVPLWIALWWVLAILIWDDLSARLQALLAGLGVADRGSAARESR
jgi:hypothetical protein